MTHFCTIAPTAFLSEFAEGRPYHLLLAHLIEQDPSYRQWYADHKVRHPNTIYLMDNGAFELYKAGLPMYNSDKLIEVGKAVSADYIVMSDYPGEASSKTIEAAKRLSSEFREEGFGTFFCPQSRIGDLDDLFTAFEWAMENPDLIDYVGLSILAIPNAYGVEKGNKLQRFVSRYHFVNQLHQRGILQEMDLQGQSIHALGMVDGPNEVELLRPFLRYIASWDSSSPVWAGLNNVGYDKSPTGLINGKFEKEVDFSLSVDDVTDEQLALAYTNLEYIDSLLEDS